jgi:hypothetical protein
MVGPGGVGPVKCLPTKVARSKPGDAFAALYSSRIAAGGASGIMSGNVLLSGKIEASSTSR